MSPRSTFILLCVWGMLLAAGSSVAAQSRYCPHCRQYHANCPCPRGVVPQPPIIPSPLLPEPEPLVPQEPSGPSASDRSAAPGSPRDASAAPGLQFAEQSAAFAGDTFAAAPPMIGDHFGGGSTTSILTQLLPQRVLAYGYLSEGTPPGDPNASIDFEIVDDQQIISFYSSGTGVDDSGNGLIDTFHVDAARSDLCPPGSYYAGGTATVVDNNEPFQSGDMWTIDYDCARPITIVIPNPATGGAVVGRLKIAENNSPLPRDRVFVNYSLFDNVPLVAGGVTVNRLSPGLEKTFWNGAGSIELRAPLAATLDSTILVDAPPDLGDVQFGNIFLALKLLLLERRSTLISAGLSVTIPTADDLRVRQSDGSDLLHVDNQSFHVMPYVGWLGLLSDRWFTQGFLQADFDANGNSVWLAGPDQTMADYGTLQDSSFLYLDVGLGYWLRRPQDCPHARITGIVPTAELHWNRSLQDTDVLSAGNFRIGEFKRNVEVINLVAGCTVQFAGNAAVTLGYAVPVGNGRDQLFDGELRAFWNRAF